MNSDGYLAGDGSWELRILVTDMKVERILRVKGDLHVGGLMLKLVEDLEVSNDWSDHALWWPAQNKWLTRTRSTLDQYSVQADALLHFTPMHKTLRVQFPDLRILDVRVDFSVKTFAAVVKLCKELGIRHAEELSLCRPLVSEHLKRNYKYVGVSPRQRTKEGTGTINFNQTNNSDTGSPDSTLNSPLNSTKWNNSLSYNGSLPGMQSFSSENSFQSQHEPLAQSPVRTPEEAKKGLLRPKTLAERARINAGWLDSSLSVMEQEVREYDLLLLRYKFYIFYDLNPKKDGIRINQIYEQAKWAILTEEIDCTEEEMMLFAGLQLQVNLQANVPQPENFSKGEDDIDSALNDLQVTLEGSSVSIGVADITQVPELADYLRFLKPKRFTLKGFKRVYCTFKDTRMSLYKSKEESQGYDPFIVINLKGSEVTPDVNLSQGKFGIRLEVPGSEGMTEYWLRCNSEDQYANWMAGCRLASKGKTMADSSYDFEVRSILQFLNMQRPAPTIAVSPSQVEITIEEFVAPRFLKKLKGKQTVVQRILEAHGNVKDLTLMDAKLNYIRAWQALPDYGISLFVVRFDGCKKDELLGVAFNKLMRMELTTGDHIKTWRFNTMKAWNVNWEVKKMKVQFEEDENVIFACLSADCKTVHEFIGGYIFLSMRSKDQNQALNEELFHKLTGGWV